MNFICFEIVGIICHGCDKYYYCPHVGFSGCDRVQKILGEVKQKLEEESKNES